MPHRTDSTDSSASFADPIPSAGSRAPAATADVALPVPVLVVEDEPLLQRRLSLVLGQLGYAQDDLVIVGSLAQARQFLKQQPVALALVDLELPDGNGRSLILELRADDPGLGILVVSAWSSEDAILGALKAGATGYVLKERDDLEVLLSIRSVLRGGAPIDPFIARRILELLPASPRNPARAHGEGPELSERETAILRLVANGMTNREIAEHVSLSRFTVDTHIKRIYRKLAVSSRVSAVQEAKARGWIE
ncbi:response regulator transcription factor [Diaphorobacter ruginosibacter]|uniref:response regulator transcription factor n=1 Tax=Diaphorobacter ruginosibacter TaxID=1715720 RepID=UPI00333EF4CA